MMLSPDIFSISESLHLRNLNPKNLEKQKRVVVNDTIDNIFKNMYAHALVFLAAYHV